jgi:hypothetical protein
MLIWPPVGTSLEVLDSDDATRGPYHAYLNLTVVQDGPHMNRTTSIVYSMDLGLKYNING